MSILSTAWSLLDSQQKRRLAALQALSMLMALSTVSGIAIVLPFFTILTDPSAIHRSAVLRFAFAHLSFGGEHGFLVALGILFIVIVLLANGINLFGTLIMNRFAFQVGNGLQTALFDEYLHRSYQFHSANSSSALATKVIYESSRLTAGILQNGQILVTNLVAAALIIASVIAFNPLVAASAALVLGASYAAIYLVFRGKLQRNGMVESRSYEKRNRVVNEGFGAVKEIILWQTQAPFVDKFGQTCTDISQSVVSTLTISQSPRYLLESVSVCMLVIAALYLGGRSDGGGPLIAQLGFFGLATYRLLPALQQAFAAVAKIRTDRCAFMSVASDLRQGQDRNARRHREPLQPLSTRNPQPDIRLHSMTYRHVTGGPAAVRDMSLDIPGGTMIGLTGANGSGKTTLVDILSGLLVPQTGRIDIDGTTLDDTTRTAWLSSIAYMPQHIYLCDCTVAENIALGVPLSLIDRDRVQRVVRLAGLGSCIANLPLGYDEPVGEYGARLSGGQRQRLGIARALYRDAPLLILDESTSSLDIAAENEIAAMLQTQRRGRTTVIVAHRISALRHCDVIYELAGGRIVRRGTFEQLCGNSLEAVE